MADSVFLDRVVRDATQAARAVDSLVVAIRDDQPEATQLAESVINSLIRLAFDALDESDRARD